jgi:outer membrane protein assembly factor BamB
MKFKTKYSISISIIALAVCALGFTAYAKIKSLEKPISFSIEPISKIRSQDIKPELAAPVIHNNLIYIASSRKKLVSFDLQGYKKASIELKFVPMTTPGIADLRIFMGGDDGYFHCLDLETGKEIWAMNLKTIDFSPPSFAAGNVIFQTGSDRVLALDMGSGEWRWEYQHLRGEDLSVRGLCRPLVKDDNIYVGLSGGAVIAMDAVTGRVLWKRAVFEGEQFQDVDAPLMADDMSVFAVSVSGKIASLSRKTGNLFWIYNAGGLAGSVLEGETIYIATDDAELMAINKITGRPVWTTPLGQREKLNFFDLPTSPQVVGQGVVLVTRNGKVILADKALGTIMAEKSFHTDTSSPVVTFNSSGFMFVDNKGIARLWHLSQ